MASLAKEAEGKVHGEDFKARITKWSDSDLDRRADFEGVFDFIRVV